MKLLSQTPLAIVGMACRLPGADHLDKYWDLLINGKSAIREIPNARLNQELHHSPKKGVSGKSYVKVGALVDYPAFDASRCPLPTRLLPDADIVQLSICQVAAEACRDAGMNPFDLPIRNTGVYIGHTLAGPQAAALVYSACVEEAAQHLRKIDAFHRLLGPEVETVMAEVVQFIRHRLPRRLKDGHPVLMANLAASLISESLQLNGPSIVLDAACSSSLQALALAARALCQRHIDMAIVGGASYINADSLILFSQAQSVAEVSCPFDADAQGMVAGEGQVAVVVKTLDRAMVDGDRIHGVIRGIGVSSDGRGKSLWAPRKEGQIEAIRRAYANDLDMSRLQYVEVHATSTQAGDVTELTALGKVLTERLPRGTRIPIGGVKANIGHTLETAGVAALVKVLLAMKYETVPRQINLCTPNPEIDWANAPFYVPTSDLPWPVSPDGQPRRAAVNAFGVGGLNVHVVVDEFTPQPGRQKSIAVGVAEDRGRPASQGQDAVAIVGMGCILPGARTLEAFWDLLVSGSDPKVDVPPNRWDSAIGYRPGTQEPWRSAAKRGGFICDFEYDWKRHKVPPKQIARADPLQFMILDAADAALRQAGYDAKPYDRSRVAAVVGTLFGSDFSNDLQLGLRLPEFKHTLAQVLRKKGVPEDKIEAIGEAYAAELLKQAPAMLDETGSFTPSTLASRITKSFDLMGGAVALDAGQCSSLAAVATAADMLLTGDCDMVICAGGHRAMGLPLYEQLSMSGALVTGDPRAPFDAEAKGHLPGEGVGVLLLKRLSDANRDGDPIRGIIRGIGTGFAASTGDASKVAIERALERAAVSSSDVGLVETGAAGTEDADKEELKALVEVHSRSHRQEPLVLGSLVGQLGYLFGASGMASMIKVALALEHRQVPGTFGLEQPAPWVAEEATVWVSKEHTSLKVPNAEGRAFAGVMNHDANGPAYHVIVERGSRVPEATTGTPALPRPMALADCRIVRQGGPSLSAILEQLPSLADQAEARYRAARTSGFNRDDRFRLAIVAQDPAELAEKARLAAAGLGANVSLTALEGKGIFCSEIRTHRPRVAFLFAGQGSQYAGMLQTLLRQSPVAARIQQRLDATLVRLGYPTFADLAWQHGDLLGTDVWRTQLSLLIADTILYGTLAVMGLQPDCIGGHSYGELPALVAAGAWSFEEAALATEQRWRVVEQCPHIDGSMLSVASAADVVDRYCQEFSGRVHVANCNAPQQTVVGGDSQSLTQLDARLRAEGLSTRLLAVPRPFHTPLMREVCEPFHRALKQIPVHPPRVPVISSVTNRFVAEPDEIRKNLAEQMATRLQYVELVQRLADEGVEVFVEIGPSQVLTGLHRKILEGRNVRLVAADHRKRGGLEPLLYVQACLETCGAEKALTQAVMSIDIEATAPRPVAPQPTTAKSVKTTAVPKTNGSPREAAKVGVRHDVLRVVRLGQTPYEMGRVHGESLAEPIRTILRRYADVANTRWDDLPNLDAFIARAETCFAEEDLEELQGIADGAGVPVSAILAHNLRIYPSNAGCIHFALSAASNVKSGMLHAANSDVPLALVLRDCLEWTLQARYPKDGIPHVTFAVAGQMAGKTGFNAKGLAMTSAVLLDRSPRQSDAEGRLHAVIAKRILGEAEDIESAVEIVRRNPGTGAWGLCLSHFPTDRVCYVEYDGQAVRVQDQRRAVAACNHSLLLESKSPVPAHSQNRFARLMELLGGEQFGPVEVPRVQAILRDRYDRSRGRKTRYRTMHTICRVDNQLSILLQPSEGKLWVARSTSRNGQEEPCETDDQFQQVNLNDLLTGAPVTSPQPSESPNGSVTVVHAVSRVGSVAESKEDICHRYILRMQEASLPADSQERFQFQGPALIVGQNETARVLAERIRQQGGIPVELPLLDDADQTLAALERLWESTPAPHLFLLTSCEDDAATVLADGPWNRRRYRGLLLPFLICQRWFQLLTKSRGLSGVSLMAVTRLGGDFGASGQISSVEGGALLGLIKGLRVEAAVTMQGVQDFRTRVLDTTADDQPEAIADRVLCELAANHCEVEISYVNGTRYVARPLADPVVPLPPNGFTPRGTWVFTGGARGITAAIAREMRRRFGLRLHLIGASPLPDVDDAWRNLSPDELRKLRAKICEEAVARGEVPIRAWQRVEKALEIDRNLRAFAASGLAVTYHCCDVSDRVALAEVLQKIRAADGPIQGVIHGAGVESACGFAKKKREMVLRTIGAKLDGAASLMELTSQDPIRWFVAFGSTSGRFGGVGQSDYCLANEMLSKLVGWYRQQRPGCHATTMQWHAWDEVGMAARPETKESPVLRGMRFMPPAEGVGHLVDEILAGMPEREVLITDPNYAIQFYPDLPRLPKGRSVPPLFPRKATSAGKTASSLVSIPDRSRFPLLDAASELIPGQRLSAEVHLRPTEDPFLREHRFRDKPMLPIVIAAELFAEAATLLTGGKQTVVGLRDVDAVDSLRLFSTEPMTARVHSTLDGSLASCQLTSDFYNRARVLVHKDRLHFRAAVELAEQPSPIEASSPGLPETWFDVCYPDGDLPIYHGPVFRCLKQSAVDPAGGWGKIVMPSPESLTGERRGGKLIIPAVVLDACFFACGICVWVQDNQAVAIPQGIRHLRLGRLARPGEECILRLNRRLDQPDHGSFNFTLFGDDGGVILQVEGYQVIVLSRGDR